MAGPARNRPPRPRRLAPDFDTNLQKAMAVEAGMPLGHMLEVMNDPNAPPARRDRMARAAAKYVHAKADSAGKKYREEEEARKAGGMDTEWAGDLAPDGHRPR